MSAATSLIGNKRGGKQIAESDLEDLFGIEIMPDDARSKTYADGAQASNFNRKTTKSKASKPAISSVSIVSTAADSILKNHTVATKVPTGKSVKELRLRLDLSQSQLSILIGVSITSVITWEKKRGRLNLQSRTMSALNDAEKLTKKQALKRLSQSSSFLLDKNLFRNSDVVSCRCSNRVQRSDSLVFRINVFRCEQLS